MREEISAIQTASMTVGQAGDGDSWSLMQDNGSNIISGYIGLRPRSERTLSQDEVSDKLRKLLASYPELIFV